MIYLKTIKEEKCPKCGGSELRIIFANFKEEENFELVEKIYNGELQVEDVFSLVKYCYDYVNHGSDCYFNEANFSFNKDLENEMFNILREKLEAKPSKEEFENLNNEEFCDYEKEEEIEEVEYIIKGNKSDIQNLEVLLDWIHYLSVVGSTRTISFEVDGDGPTFLRISRKDGKPLKHNTIKYGHKVVYNKALKRLSI